MQQTITLKLLPHEANNSLDVTHYLAQSLSIPADSITGYNILKRSIDARAKQAYVNLSLQAFINEPYHQREIIKIQYPDVSRSKHKVIIIGAGPAGLFAALQLIEHGIKPVILERGKDVRARRRDLAVLNKEGIVNPESNYCFGEGGAGTYSDGKLYTRSNKRGDINRILNIFVQFGAEEKILYEAHPHIGTNKLPQIITAMRQQIEASGGKLLFNKKVVDIRLADEAIKEVITADGEHFNASAVLLATGHSARDIFQLLQNKNILIEAKPFALGVRIEHPQQIIDNVQYHQPLRNEFLPPASYSLVQQVDGKGVFSFCMCPGGIIAPAATNNDELVVNGWSPSKRNNPYANSGMVVTVDMNEANTYLKNKQAVNPLLFLQFQQRVEHQAYVAGGGKLVAPAQRMVDFCNNKTSSTLPECSYLPGVSSIGLQHVLPQFIFKSLQQGFIAFGKKMKGYFTNDAIVVATESRTSSPVRIPRVAEKLHHPQVLNLYPCGEGAGYAGGIISAAMDGEKVSNAIYQMLSNK